MSALIDGATLSALLFSHANSAGSQFGFLLGERVEQIEDRISDSQIHTADVNSFTYVTSFIPWPSSDFVHSRNGCLNETAIAKLLSEHQQSLVGWYSYRHQASLRPSLKEVTLHRNLLSCQMFSGTPQDLYFFLCSSSIQPNGSTHTCNHGFFHLENGLFCKVPMAVMNLGDTTRTEYRQRSNAALSHSSTVRSTFQDHRKDFIRATGEMDQVIKVDQLACSVNKSLSTLYTKLCKSEKDIGYLESDVQGLKQRLEILEEVEMSQVFKEKEIKKRQEEEETSMRQEEELDSDEQSQLNQLMFDLGLTDSAHVAEINGHQSVSQGASKQSHVSVARKLSIDLSSYVHIDINREENSSSPDIVCWTEPSCSVDKPKNIEQSATKANEVKDTEDDYSSDQATSVSKDPFARFGDLRQMKRDLKLSDTTVPHSKGKREQGMVQKSSCSDINLNKGSKKVQYSRQKLDMNNDNLIDNNCVSKSYSTKFSNGNKESEDSDSQMEHCSANNENGIPEALLSVSQTLPSSSPLY